MNTRPLEPRDRLDAERLIVPAAFAPWHPPTPEELAEPHVSRWTDDWGAELGVAAERSGSLVGAAWARPVDPVLARDDHGAPFWELVIAIDEPFRGHGLGRRLTLELQQLAVARDVPGLVLTVSHLNEPAVRLYRSSGFREHGRTDTEPTVMVWVPSR